MNMDITTRQISVPTSYVACTYTYISPRKHDALSRVRLPYSILGVVLKVYDTCLFSKNILSGRIYVALVIYSI